MRFLYECGYITNYLKPVARLVMMVKLGVLSGYSIYDNQRNKISPSLTQVAPIQWTGFNMSITYSNIVIKHVVLISSLDLQVSVIYNIN